MNQVMQQNLDWFPMPADVQCGSKAKGMPLPAILPPQYSGWKDFQQAWFWNLFWASAKHGGLLPTGSDLWQIAGAHTRARWDANCAAVMAAFDCTEPDADGRRQFYYAPLREISCAQQKKYRKKFQSALSETSTDLNREGGGSSSSISLSFDFDLDSKNQEQSRINLNTREELMSMKADDSSSANTREERNYEIRDGARRILRILGLPDTHITAAIAAVGTQVKTGLSMDGIVQRITTDANHAERIGVPRQDFLNDFLAQTSARQILDVLNLPLTNNFILRLSAVVKAEAKDTGLAFDEVASRITQAASEDRRRGMKIDIFYFEDVKWRSNARTNKAEQRKLDNLEVNARVKQRLREKLGAS
jgi:hypothetical protein